MYLKNCPQLIARPRRITAPLCNQPLEMETGRGPGYMHRSLPIVVSFGNLKRVSLRSNLYTQVQLHTRDPLGGKARGATDNYTQVTMY